MKCISCDQRKGKRFCPSIEGRICTICCGTKRKKEITCHNTCLYLPKATAYQAKKGEIREIKERVRQLASLEKNTLSMLQISVILWLKRHILEFYKENPELVDKDVQEAIELLIKNYQIRKTGLIYEQRAERYLVQSLSITLQDALDNVTETPIEEIRLNLEGAIECLSEILEMVLLLRSRDVGEREYLKLLIRLQDKIYGEEKYQEDSPIKIVSEPVLSILPFFK